MCFSVLQWAMKFRWNALIKWTKNMERKVTLEVPKVKWEDIGGQREVKNQLLETLVWPQKHRDAFTRIGTDAPSGVLMYGPPGCSKTLIARAVASEVGLNFLAVKGPELFSKWVGESEKAVRSLFVKARDNAPSVIFFDEIDSLAMNRGRDGDGVSVSDRVMAQLLVHMDGVRSRGDVAVIAATNRPDNIDPALLRPGIVHLYVGPPNEKDREEIFSIHLRKTPYDSDVSMKELAQLTDGYTGADISLVCRQAALAALEESFDASVVTMKHFKMAIEQVQPSEIQFYQKFSATFHRGVRSDAVDVNGDAVVGGGKPVKKNGAAGEGRNRRALLDIGNVKQVCANVPTAAVDGVAAVAKRVAPKPAVQKKVTAKPKPVQKEVIEISDEKDSEDKAAACGLTNKPKEIVDIDAGDANNELAAVEYLEYIYKFYKIVENENRPHDYMDSQPEINEKTRALIG
ncbi:unnamed protein product [Trifolium pratense]|uniref:Uncharacterized protein n=1 Tax=Trifolium pratense TaxID=57577 RepID=A0ACB0LTH5_TRIPR|nr:unnamed protein product [Trifolium pratense]